MEQQDFNEINNRVNTIACFLCGREFGTKGFAFHFKECKVKFSNEQKLRPNKQRIKMPQLPEGIDYILDGNFSKIDLKKFNIKSSEIYKYKVLPGCKYCGRTFNYQSLAPHMKGCDKQKHYREQKQNIQEILFKVPKTLVCCVCGQRFGTFSLKIHYSECSKKFNDEQFRIHKKQEDRRRPPQFDQVDAQAIKRKERWNQQQIQEFNNRATELYRQKGMSQCYNCKRKFIYQQLNKHQKNCELINGSLNPAPQKVAKKQLEIRKPRTVMCLICGRQYGAVSIAIHNQSCVQLFEKQQLLKLKNQRKPIPDLPSHQKEIYSLKQAENWPIDKIESYNKLVSHIYNTKSLAKCYICNRTFFEESLSKHFKQCQTKIKDVRKLQKFKKQIKSKNNFFGQDFLQNVIQMNKQINKVAVKNVSKPKMLMCYLCGRQYGFSSLKIHLPQCKLKPINSKKLQQDIYKKNCERIEEKYSISSAQAWSLDQIEAYNKQVYEIYKKQSLFECKYCHRTFFQQSLIKHIKHCEKEDIKKKKLMRCQTMKEFAFINEQNIDEQFSLGMQKQISQIEGPVAILKKCQLDSQLQLSIQHFSEINEACEI